MIYSLAFPREMRDKRFLSTLVELIAVWSAFYTEYGANPTETNPFSTFFAGLFVSIACIVKFRSPIEE